MSFNFAAYASASSHSGSKPAVIITVLVLNLLLLSIFSKNNINPIDCLNKRLDPNFHQAMMEIEDDQKEPGTIVQEIQKGFTIKDRLLRPSLVGVSKKTEVIDKESSENKENKENN